MGKSNSNPQVYNQPVKEFFPELLKWYQQIDSSIKRPDKAFQERPASHWEHCHLNFSGMNNETLFENYQVGEVFRLLILPS